MKKLSFKQFIFTPDLRSTKIKFNMHGGGSDALDLLLKDDTDDYDWIEMNSWRGPNQDKQNKLDGYEYLVAMAKYYPYGDNFYLFGGIYKVTKIEPAVTNGIGYKLDLLPDCIEYKKRLVAKLSKPIGQSYNRVYESFVTDDNIEVYEILPSAKLSNFNGYNNVSLTHKELQSIINDEGMEWKSALSYIKAVYVITDKNAGKLYVGSAYGDGGLWGRWSGYADINNLTNDNKYFRELVDAKGKEYIINNFSYSIIEIFDKKTRDEEIIRREHYWMGVLDTVKNGMNN